MQQYFVNYELVVGNTYQINEDDSHHIKNVMRMRENDSVILSDGNHLFNAHIVSTLDNVSVFVDSMIEKNTEMPIEVTIAQGMVRREKMEEVIDYSCELGATSYLPVMMERSIVKLDQKDFNKKLDRLNKIAKEASEQAHRIKKLEVEPLISFKELLNKVNDYDLCLVAYEKEVVSHSLEQIINPDLKKILVLVGPEGGVSEKELDLMLKANFKACSLGPRILRTQVAPYYILSSISSILGGK